MQKLNEFLIQLNSYISGDWFVFLLLGTGIFFTLYLRFPQIRYFNHAIRITRGKYDRKGDEGDASHFQALATALSGTVGTGNIGGVALAVHLGGPGALFWMLATALVGMTTKFVEVTLSHKYRERAKDGSIAGGPMYYMKKRLNINLDNGKQIKTGLWLGGVFAVCTILSSFGTGNLPQINNIATSIYSTFGVDQMLTGAVLSVLLAMVILGGIRRIVQVTGKLVPIMAVIYFLGSISVILYNYDQIIPSFLSIFQDIFTGSSAVGGFLGANLAFAFNRGVNRGLFSNEAGQGSAPIAHAAARAHEPVSEGMVAILEPFIDTIIICMLTGLVLLSSGAWNTKYDNEFQYADIEILAGTYTDQDQDQIRKLSSHLLGLQSLQTFSGELEVDNGKVQDGITLLHARSVAEDVQVLYKNEPFTGKLTFKEGNFADNTLVTFRGKSLIHSASLTAEAFKLGFLGDFGQYIVSIGLLLFAFSTAISWSYYGGRATTYLFGSDKVIYFRIVYVTGFFVASFTDTTIIWTFSGITIALMAIPNLFGILFLHREIKETVDQYWKDFKDEFPNEKAHS